MRVALCNEVVAPMPFGRQCDGLEVAPYALSEEPHRIGAQDEGIAIAGLHGSPHQRRIEAGETRAAARAIGYIRGILEALP